LHGAKSGLYGGGCMAPSLDCMVEVAWRQVWTVWWMRYDGEIQLLSCLHGGPRSVTPSVVTLKQNVLLVLPDPSSSFCFKCFECSHEAL
jgi:hypothetical protein